MPTSKRFAGRLASVLREVINTKIPVYGKVYSEKKKLEEEKQSRRALSRSRLKQH
jgi:hypothetical protein